MIPNTGGKIAAKKRKERRMLCLDSKCGGRIPHQGSEGREELCLESNYGGKITLPSSLSILHLNALPSCVFPGLSDRVPIHIGQCTGLTSDSFWAPQPQRTPGNYAGSGHAGFQKLPLDVPRQPGKSNRTGLQHRTAPQPQFVIFPGLPLSFSFHCNSVMDHIRDNGLASKKRIENAGH